MQVELVSRVCRQWTDQHKEVLDKTAVKEGEIIIKAGLQVRMTPGSGPPFLQ